MSELHPGAEDALRHEYRVLAGIIGQTLCTLVFMIEAHDARTHALRDRVHDSPWLSGCAVGMAVGLDETMMKVGHVVNWIQRAGHRA